MRHVHTSKKKGGREAFLKLTKYEGAFIFVHAHSETKEACSSFLETGGIFLYPV